ncbi:hypothetical protein [Stenotrophomonas indicatrix]|uniref:hypothetical protein n=1 Tax=Stenotrophomonas indicatrix TaxID=2045451 RepID=UPI000B43BC73|nr:hypothetical protein [Stenotrophomonas indicatrix]
MSTLPFPQLTTAGRCDELHRACLAIEGSSGAAALWEEEVRTMCGQPEATSSNLAGGGDPVEFQFVWAADSGQVDCRVTVDAAPDATPQQRLTHCLALAPSLPSGSLDTLRPLLDERHGNDLRYGGWIGTRRRAGSFNRKLYLEIHAGSEWHAITWPRLSAFMQLPVRGLVPIMAGVDPARPGIEVYCDVAPMATDALAIICTRTALPAQSRKAIALLEALMQQRIGAEMPSAEQGLSLALDAQGRVISLTWHAPADALLGPAPQAREALLRLGKKQGWNMAAYAAMSAPDQHAAVPWHGVVGLTISDGAGVLLSATCSTRPGCRS